MKPSLAFLLLAFLVFSCKHKSIEEYKKELCEFQLQNSKKHQCKIYKICIRSDYAFTDEQYKTLFFNKNEEFDAKGGFELEGNIGEWISADTLSVYRFIGQSQQPKDTIARISYEKFGAITFKVKNYSASNAGYLNEYSFDNFKIKNNIISFYGTHRILGPEIEKNIQVRLGNLKIETDADTITKIISDRVETNMNFIYHNPDGTCTEHLPEVSVLTTYYYPKKTMHFNSNKPPDHVFVDVK